MAANPLAVLSWQPQRADAVWTRGEFSALCEHLHNGNGGTHFAMGFQDKDGCKKYVRSKRLAVGRAISWSWQSISGSPKSRLAFVPYSTNERQESRWGGLDFDAHSGETERAREMAFAAFRVLLNAPGLAVILETSGSGGWHVWAVSPDFHDTREWIRLLKSVAGKIGVPVVSGVCEIFPPDSLPSRFGKGMRAPGCWNPGTDSCSEIVWENCRTSLESVLSGKSKNAALNCNALESHFPDTKKETSSTGWIRKTSGMYFGLFGATPGKPYRTARQIFQLCGTTWGNGWASPAKARLASVTSSPGWGRLNKRPNMFRTNLLRVTAGFPTARTRRARIRFDYEHRRNEINRTRGASLKFPLEKRRVWKPRRTAQGQCESCRRAAKAAVERAGKT